MSLESSAVNQHKTPAEQDHFQDEIQPFSLSDDEKDQPVGHGIESERKVGAVRNFLFIPNGHHLWRGNWTEESQAVRSGAVISGPNPSEIADTRLE